MTPTPKMIALAERIAEDGQVNGWYYHTAFEAALFTIMEVSEKAAALCDGRGADFTACAIRDGEHLK